MLYGQLPVDLGVFNLNSVPEMMFVQYIPIKMANCGVSVKTPPHLRCFNGIIRKILCDYVGEFGIDELCESYVYLTAKRMWQDGQSQFNRLGWHSDGFMTSDINYIWSDKDPTVFNRTKMDLTQDDNISMKEMEQKAVPELDIIYPNNSILRLNQYVVHRVNPNPTSGMRTFIKVSFSKDKYDLEGNAHNYEFDYNWPMRSRSVERNIPQSDLK